MMLFMIELFNKKDNKGKMCPNAMREIPKIYNYQHKDEDKEIHGHPTNCWSTTLYTLGASDKIKYVDDWQIEEWLIVNTVRISKRNGKSKREFGDILVLKKEDDITYFPTHTAIYLGKNLYWHQKFYNGPWQIITLEDILHYYCFEKFYHVRPKSKNKWKTNFDFLVKEA